MYKGLVDTIRVRTTKDQAELFMRQAIMDSNNEGSGIFETVIDE